ncbi:ribosomal protection-like ABC-F family protein [Listeria costaricensis]|uniref:ribosomal protection-like ABC-F family protein n=1 Tax=Listeria costaricensis TaxID=2026604 RepID=UPI000C07928A|nr:ABC-F type ribosomal protection protein [Listeria costaricensis]
MIITAINQVSKNFGGDQILENVSLQIMDNERMGLIGRNGEGKSTILKIIAGLERVDSGEVTIKRGLQIGYLNQIPESAADQTVYQYLLSSFEKLNKMAGQLKFLEEEMAASPATRLIERYGELQEQFIKAGGYEMEHEVERIMQGLGISKLQSHPYAALSGGEKTKVNLAAQLLQKPDLLLLDEPTNHLDLHAVEWLTQFLTRYKGAVVIVSHDRYFLDETVQKIVELENKELITYHTNFSGYLKEREERLLREFQAYKDQQKKIKKMKQAIKRLRQWAMEANPPNDAFFRRAKNMERALERMELVKKPVLEQKEMRLQFENGGRGSGEIVRAEGIWLSFGEKPIFEEAELLIKQGERVAIVGENGAGKSTLLKLCLGELTPDAGEFRIGPSVQVAYLSQQMEEMAPNLTVLEAFRDKVRVTEGEARQLLAGFMFYQEMVFQKVSALSGGERTRLRLAQFIHQPVNTLILDEPTNHLDIASREVLEEAIKNFAGTVIVVSHDRYFMNQICDRTILLENCQLTSFSGNYSYYLEKRKQLAESL